MEIVWNGGISGVVWVLGVNYVIVVWWIIVVEEVLGEWLFDCLFSGYVLIEVG